MKCLKLAICKSICNKFKTCLCIWFCTLLLNFGNRAYLCPKKGRATFFSTRKNCSEILAFYSVITQSVIQSLEENSIEMFLDNYITDT